MAQYGRWARMGMAIGALAWCGALPNAAAEEAVNPATTVTTAPQTAEQEATLWYTDFAAAQAKAKELNRLMLVDFSGSDWCGWCKKLDKEVFSQPEFLDFAKANFVLVLIDFPQYKELAPEVRKQNEELAAKYGVEGFPTVMFINAEGKAVGRTGYEAGGAEKYVAMLQRFLTKYQEKQAQSEQ